jgi:membrane protein YqaA with SNARE-associated domain
MEEDYTTSNVFQYNRAEKLRFALFTFGFGLLIILLFGTYLLFLKEQDIGVINFVKDLAANIQTHIEQGTINGVLYASIFGGLFFVTIPMEAVFVSFLEAGTKPVLLVGLFLFGFLISFTINYIIGLKLDHFSKKIITPQKFYKIKGILNKYGVIAIFVINVIPFLPSQPLSTILGVFRYNKAKFYVSFLAGQLIKFAAIAIGYIYIFQ